MDSQTGSRSSRFLLGPTKIWPETFHVHSMMYSEPAVGPKLSNYPTKSWSEVFVELPPTCVGERESNPQPRAFARALPMYSKPAVGSVSNTATKIWPDNRSAIELRAQWKQGNGRGGIRTHNGCSPDRQSPQSSCFNDYGRERALRPVSTLIDSSDEELVRATDACASGGGI
jgi:hypothetical protein